MNQQWAMMSKARSVRVIVTIHKTIKRPMFVVLIILLDLIMILIRIDPVFMSEHNNHHVVCLKINAILDTTCVRRYNNNNWYLKISDKW